MVIADLYKEYEKIIPDGASDIQRQETKRAFYAGARSLFWSIVHSLDYETEPTEADLRLMDSIKDELDRWVCDVAEGRA